MTQHGFVWPWWGGVPLLASLLLAGCSCSGARPAGGGGGLAEAERLYDEYCALCHARGGAGYAADNATRLRGQHLLRSASDAYLRVAIAEGRPGTPMSAWGREHGGPLSNRQVDLLVALMRSWQRGGAVALDERPSQGDARRGADLYAVHCAGCHGEGGEGGSGTALRNPVFQRSASDGFLRYAIEKGREQTPMPGFEGSLQPGLIEDLVAFVRALGERSSGQAATSTGGGGSADAPAADAAIPEHPPRRGVVIFPEGPPARFAPRDDLYVSVEQLAENYRRGARMVVADARAPGDHALGHLPGAVSVPFYEAAQWAPRLPRDGTWIVAYCGCPHAASGKLARALRDLGFRHVAVLDEGFYVWRDRGLPVVTEAP